MSREAFGEVQKKLVDTQKQYRHMQQQQATTQREALQAKLTADELAKVGEGAPVYKAIGALTSPRVPPPAVVVRTRVPVRPSGCCYHRTRAPRFPSRLPARR
jgi:hypothetical protein|eukprot:COSAG06_NODE_4628_length_4087_cov_9.310682_5_plen_102_part_00